MSGAFGDHFASVATAYSRARPHYPASLFAAIEAELGASQRAWDCATGSGQALAPLAARFAEVVASDASPAQLAHIDRARYTNVLVVAARAEAVPLADASCDLVTVAQALHWFAGDAFYREARRVLRRDGLIAAWSYNLLTVTGPVDAVIARLYHEVLAGCWPVERRAVEDGYASLPWPFRDGLRRHLEMSAHWDCEHLLAYLASWSAVATCRRRYGRDAIVAVADEIRAAWGRPTRRWVRWPLVLRLGRRP